MAAFLENWKPYLKTDDYNYLTTFVENVNQNIVNQHILILVGSGCNGKTKLTREIIEKMGGYDFCCQTLNDITEKTNRKMIVLDDGEEIDDEQSEFLLYMLNKENMVLTTFSLDGIPEMLHPHSRFIVMDHVFRS